MRTFVSALLIFFLIEKSGQLDLSSRALWNPNGITMAGWPNATNGSHISQLTNPLDITISNDRLFVSDHSNNRILVISLNDSNQKKSITGLNFPKGMFIVNETLYFIHKRCTIEQVSLNSLNQTKFFKECSNLSHYLFVDDANNFYFSSMVSHQVTRYRHDNWANEEIVAGNGFPGTSELQLNHPYGIFVDHIGSLYIADCYNHRIRLWFKNSKSGIIVAGDGTGGSKMTQVTYPTQVVVDSHGYMYISESSPGRITRWAFGFSYGVCLVGCHGSGTDTGQLTAPHSLAFDKDGSLYVNDWGNHRIQKFLLLNYTEKEPAYLQIPRCPMKDMIGHRCNVSSDPCQLLKPCRNKRICQRISDDPGYKCVCSKNVSDEQCDKEDEICPENFCRNGNCRKSEDSKFICDCQANWTGVYCETMINYCQSITCLNGGVCRRLLGGYQCECLPGSYSGHHCEIVARRVTILKIVSKSFAYVAIIAISMVAAFVIIMDLLKYGFGIDPVREEREEIRQKKNQKAKIIPIIRVTPSDYIP